MSTSILDESTGCHHWDCEYDGPAKGEADPRVVRWYEFRFDDWAPDSVSVSPAALCPEHADYLTPEWAHVSRSGDAPFSLRLAPGLNDEH